MALDPEVLEHLLETVRRFVSERLRPLEEQVAEDDAIPEDVDREMRELGLYGLSIPEEYGGLGLTMEEECLVAFELGHTSPAFRSAFGTNVGIGSQGVVMFGTEEQKERWLPGIASGELVTSFALSEPDAGSDAAAVQTTAIQEGDEYVLNGTKRFITNADRADLFTVMARTDPDTPGARGVTAFVVDADSDGISIGAPEKKMGQQGAHVCDVYFDDVRVPERNRLGDEGKGFKVAMQVLDRGRLHISAVAVGVAERLIEDSVRYASEREQFEQPIIDFQLIQGRLADMKTEALAARSLVLDTARKRDAGENV
ncbi:MAG: acyl-CoA dehydrogenase family protein, partial [Gemmatimonadota bacterium]